MALSAMEATKLLSDDAIVVAAIAILASFSILNIFFMFLWNHGLNVRKRKVYLTRLMASTKSTQLHDSNEPPPVTFVKNISHSRSDTAVNGMNVRAHCRSSRHGLFADDSSDNEGAHLEALRIPPYQDSKVLPSKRGEDSPISLGSNQVYHLHYSSSNGAPFSPLYNLPNISPYPTPLIRREEVGEESVRRRDLKSSLKCPAPTQADNL